MNKIEFELFETDFNKIIKIQDKVNEIIDHLNGSVCEYCGGKGWYINEDHKDFPNTQQKIDCQYCGEEDSSLKEEAMSKLIIKNKGYGEMLQSVPPYKEEVDKKAE